MNSMQPSLLHMLSPLLITGFIIAVTLFAASRKNKKRQERSDIIKAFAQEFKAQYQTHYDKVFEEGIDCEFFYSQDSNEFTNVLKLDDTSNGTVFIGDWVTSFVAGDAITKANHISNEDSLMKALCSKSLTMGVIFDERLNLPEFALWPETLGVKMDEVIRINTSEDIDYAEDKEFSDMWWLCSHKENQKIKEIFNNPQLRHECMNFAKKKYRMAGFGKHLVIVSHDALSPSDYNEFLDSLREWQKIISTHVAQ